MYANVRNAYETVSRATESSRELESAALFKAARQLDACRQAWEAGDRSRKLEEALQHNLRLWTFFQTELADPQHGLPVELRLNLLRISNFIDRRTFEIMANPDPAKLQALIDINRHVASGLAERVS
jgi:flagellar protein FlaF